MKKNLYTHIILIITSLCFISCSKFNLFPEEKNPYHHGILKTINDTMTKNPEDALKIIDNIGTETIHNFTKQEYYEYQILLAEAHYKNYYPQNNRNEIINACNYFDSLSALYTQNQDILFLNSRALYYNAVGDEEKDENKNAFKNYLESLKIINRININSRTDNTNDILHFKALIYTRLGDILYWHDVYVPAIECINNANKLFELENNQNVLSRNNIIIAVIYGLNYNHDKALHHLAIADSILQNSEINIVLKNDIERIKASVMYNIGYKEESFNSILKQYKTIDDQAQAMEIAGVLGDMYYDMKIYDSAIYYYEKYFPNNKYSKINAANNIIEISILTGNNELITKYAPSLAEETNKEIMLSSIKTELSSLFLKYKEEKKHETIYDNIIKHLFLIFLITIIFFIIGLNLINLKKKKYRNEILQKKNHIALLQKKINKTSSENKHIKLQMKNLEDEILNIKNRINANFIPFEERLDTIKNTALYERLYKVSVNSSIKTNNEYEDLLLSDQEQIELIDLFNKALDNALNDIISEHRGLKYHDMLYFCLYIIGLDEKHISAVTGKSYNAIWNRTKKIQEILNTDKKIRDIVKEKVQSYRL